MPGCGGEGMTRERELEIISAVLSGDANAFEELVLEYQTRVYNIAMKMTGNEDDAFDISQEAFLKAYRALGGFRGEASFGSWLYRLTANLSVDFMRREARHRPEKAVYLDDETEGERPVEIPDLSSEPQTALERRETLEAIEAGLKRLPEEQRLILVMRDFNGLSYQEISEALNVEMGTVKSRIYRARARLASFLLSEGNFFKKTSSKKVKER
jgi:RNA polymerase sigma-70 factor (ECF subfamily)